MQRGPQVARGVWAYGYRDTPLVWVKPAATFQLFNNVPSFASFGRNGWAGFYLPYRSSRPYQLTSETSAALAFGFFLRKTRLPMVAPRAFG